MNKEQLIEQIVNKIFELSSLDKSSRGSVKEFIATAINGDDIRETYTTVFASPKGDVCLTFVLTNVRLIKIEITSTEKTSQEFSLPSLKMDWASGENEGLRISSPEGSFTLRNIDEEDRGFFKAVGEARAKIGAMDAPLNQEKKL